VDFAYETIAFSRHGPNKAQFSTAVANCLAGSAYVTSKRGVSYDPPRPNCLEKIVFGDNTLMIFH